MIYFYFVLNPLSISSASKQIVSNDNLVKKYELNRNKYFLGKSNYLDGSEEHGAKNYKAERQKKGDVFDHDDLGLVKSKEDQKVREEGYRQHAFNVLVSSRLDYHRAIPDTRHKL